MISAAKGSNELADQDIFFDVEFDIRNIIQLNYWLLKTTASNCNVNYLGLHMTNAEKFTVKTDKGPRIFERC